MSELSRDDVAAITGPIGDVAIAEIIATGVTKEELEAARDRVVKDRKGQDMGLELEPGHIAKVVRILERLRDHGLLGEGGSTLE